MRNTKSLLIAALLVCASAASGFAACSWQTQCDALPCYQVPVCDAMSDFKSPVSPTARKGSKPLPPGTLPPGATSCHQQKVCDVYNKCTFKNICM